MPKYRHKPTVVEAIQYNDNKMAIVDFIGKPIGEVRLSMGTALYIETDDGLMKTAYPGDYIVKGQNGEFYPCSQEIFNELYTKIR